MRPSANQLDKISRMPLTVLDVDCDQISTGMTAYQSMLARLDGHRLRDSRFQTDHWLDQDTARGWARLVASQQGQLVGFLAGQPTTGHIALVGAVETGHRVGTALLTSFAEQARLALAPALTVTLDSEPTKRWDRRRFFERFGFRPQSGSALHFIKCPF